MSEIDTNTTNTLNQAETDALKQVLAREDLNKFEPDLLTQILRRHGKSPGNSDD